MNGELPGSVRFSIRSSVEKELSSTPLAFLSPLIAAIIEGALSPRFRTRLLPAVLVISAVLLPALVLNLPAGGPEGRQFLVEKGMSAREIKEGGWSTTQIGDRVAEAVASA